MPCQSDYPDYACEKVKAELDRVSRLLCEANKVIDRINEKLKAQTPWPSPDLRSAELLQWWEEHQKLDAERMKPRGSKRGDWKSR